MEFRPFTASFFRDMAPGLSPLHEIYLQRYLAGVGCRWTIIEPKYFDRDYLAEFAAFYGGTAKPYQNYCQRVHFFTGENPAPTDGVLAAVAGGDKDAIEVWQARYLGFCVIRPIAAARFGRTVLKGFPERDPGHPRNDNSHRDYRVNLLAGRLSVRGLAWQQQDTGVSACATVSLWTMFHAVADRERLTVPTTVEITQAATQFFIEGRPFPSGGLSTYQLSQAIRAGGLAPLVVQGDRRDKQSGQFVFGSENFTTNLATLLRAGFPVLVLGTLEKLGGHAVCAVGFRASKDAIGNPGTPMTADSTLDWLYVHDDNIGPAVRVRLTEDIEAVDMREEDCRAVSVVPDPTIQVPRPDMDYPRLIPHALLAAVPVKLRISPAVLLRRGLDLASHFTVYAPTAPVEYRCHLPRQHKYFGPLLQERMVTCPERVLSVCLRASREFQPMSRYLGVVSVTNAGHPLADFLWDTTDSPTNSRMFGAISFHPGAGDCIDQLIKLGMIEPIPHIRAHV